METVPSLTLALRLCCAVPPPQVQNARMGRALARLSQELYSKDTHFVMELVQVGCKGRHFPSILPIATVKYGWIG